MKTAHLEALLEMWREMTQEGRADTIAYLLRRGHVCDERAAALLETLGARTELVTERTK